MNRGNALSMFLLVVVSVAGCRTPDPLVAAPTAPPEVALAVDRYVSAVLSGSTSAVQASLAPSARDRVEARLKAHNRTWEDFVAAERARLVAGINMESTPAPFAVRSAEKRDAKWIVQGAVGDRVLSKPLAVEQVGDGYAFAGPGDVTVMSTSSYRIDNNTGTAHTMNCSGQSASSVPANQTTYKTCTDSCGFWAGSRFQDGATWIGYCEYNSWGADVVINGALAACVSPC